MCTDVSYTDVSYSSLMCTDVSYTSPDAPMCSVRRRQLRRGARTSLASPPDGRRCCGVVVRGTAGDVRAGSAALRGGPPRAAAPSAAALVPVPVRAKPS
jgi:hypothetical protein